ncbi:hypothetical protein GRJ2_002633800 [Grus japonensis]|uniref:Uncharacterized protein n=1 Tax=Grus japonensis TaxID=30415 RepID=A0ABC9XXN8_GRUJA
MDPPLAKAEPISNGGSTSKLRFAWALSGLVFLAAWVRRGRQTLTGFGEELPQLKTPEKGGVKRLELQKRKGGKDRQMDKEAPELYNCLAAQIVGAPYTAQKWCWDLQGQVGPAAIAYECELDLMDLKDLNETRLTVYGFLPNSNSNLHARHQ